MIIDCFITEGELRLQPTLQEKRDIISQMSPEEINKGLSPDMLVTALEMVYEQSSPQEVEEIIRKVKQAKKEKLISDTLNTDDGRKALAAAMVEPIRCPGLEYTTCPKCENKDAHVIGRKLTCHACGYWNSFWAVPGNKNYKPKTSLVTAPADKYVIDPKKKDDISDIQEQLKITANDPTLTINSGHSYPWDIPNANNYQYPKVTRCSMCGSPNVDADGGKFECQSCEPFKPKMSSAMKAILKEEDQKNLEAIIMAIPSTEEKAQVEKSIVSDIALSQRQRDMIKELN